MQKKYKWLSKAKSKEIKEAYKNMGGYDAYVNKAIEMGKEVHSYLAVHRVLNGISAKADIMDVISVMVSEFNQKLQSLKS